MMADQKIEAVRNVEAEAVVLGAMMTENKCIDRIADKLTAEDFYEPVHSRLFSAIVKEASLGRAANPVTLFPYVKADERLAELGGVGYLAQLTGSPGVLLGIDTCSDQVRDMAQRRRLIAGLREAADLAADMGATNEEVVNAADAAIASSTDQADGIVQISAGKAYDEMLAAYEEPWSGVTCGTIGCLDTVMGPIRPHHLAIVASRPGMGKSALAMSYAIGAAKNGHGVLFVSLEMSHGELMQRAAADICYVAGRGVPYEQIRDNKFSSDNTRRLVYEARHEFRDLPLHLIDASALTIGRLNMLVRRHKRRFAAGGQKLELVIVDYLQLLRPDQRTSSMYEAITEVSKGLKTCAKQHGVGVMALAQLSREVEKRQDKRPILADLRDSGQIEQDADAVCFLYREDHYLGQSRPDQYDPKYETWRMAFDAVSGQIEFIVAKRRNGPTGKAKGRFYGMFQCVRGGVE